MIKLYEKNSSLAENTTKVSSFTEDNGEYYITLEESIFFPEEGGQNADTGKIITADGTEINVLDGQLKRNGAVDVITYKVSGPIEAGCEVKCILDYDKRFDRMQNHSGEHILTGVIHNKYDLDNVGFHLSDEGPVTLDLNGQLTYEQVMDMEKEANRVIYANMPVTDSYPEKSELAELTYRSKIEIEGQVRLITIGDDNETIDVCACCAPHVKRTGEVGIIKVISVINWKGGIRISMLAGRRALEYINSEHELIRSLTGLLTTGTENILGITETHMREIGMLKSRLAKSLEDNITYKIDNEIAKNGDAANYVEFVDADFPVNSQKNVYNYMLEKYTGFVAVFAGDDETGYRYFGGSRNNDSRELATALREKFGAKGGGKPDMVQGQVAATREDITQTILGM